MSKDQTKEPEYDPKLEAFIKSLDDAEDEAERNGPVPAEVLRRNLDAIYERKAQEAKERKKAALTR